jgi:hypothetical protein
MCHWKRRGSMLGCRQEKVAEHFLPCGLVWESSFADYNYTCDVATYIEGEKVLESMHGKVLVEFHSAKSVGTLRRTLLECS